MRNAQPPDSTKSTANDAIDGEGAMVLTGLNMMKPNSQLDVPMCEDASKRKEVLILPKPLGNPNSYLKRQGRN